MSFSPALRHRQRILAAQAGPAAFTPGQAPPPPAPTTAAGQEYAGLLVLLHVNLRTLADIQSIEARNPKKREMAAAFAPWIAGVLASTATPAPQDDIVVQNMIWAVDYGDVAYALELGAHVLAHGLAMPSRFNSGAACFLAEMIADRTLKEPAFATLEQLVTLDALTAEKDMPDQARAKLAKALGRAWFAKAQAIDPTAESAPAGAKAAALEQALQWLQRALSLDDKAGVKKDIEATTRAQKSLEAPAT